MRWVLNFVWAHLQLQSDVRKVTSVFLAPVLDVIEGILSVPSTCVSRHMDMNIWIAGILWTELHAGCFCMTWRSKCANVRSFSVGTPCAVFVATWRSLHRTSDFSLKTTLAKPSVAHAFCYDAMVWR